MGWIWPLGYSLQTLDLGSVHVKASVLIHKLCPLSRFPFGESFLFSVPYLSMDSAHSHLINEDAEETPNFQINREGKIAKPPQQSGCRAGLAHPPPALPPRLHLFI